MTGDYLTRDQFGTPKTLAERYAHRWLTDHCGEAGESVMQSLAEMMIQWRANDRGAEKECARLTAENKAMADLLASVLPILSDRFVGGRMVTSKRRAGELFNEIRALLSSSSSFAKTGDSL